MHKKKLGNVGETAAALFLMKRGYEVFTEMGDSSKVDLIVLVDNKPIKIQVKSVNGDGERFGSSLHSSGPGYSYSYTSDDVDVLCVYDHTSETLAWIAAKELEERGVKSVTFALKKQARLGGPAQNLATDYLTFEDAVSRVHGSLV